MVDVKKLGDYLGAVREFDKELDSQGVIFVGRVAEIGVKHKLKGSALREYVDYTAGVTGSSKVQILSQIKNITLQDKKRDYGVTSQKFRNKTTGEVVTQFNLRDIGNFEKVE